MDARIFKVGPRSCWLLLEESVMVPSHNNLCWVRQGSKPFGGFVHLAFSPKGTKITGQDENISSWDFKIVLLPVNITEAYEPNHVSKTPTFKIM